MEEQAKKKKTKVRSPNYPGYSLDRCIKLVGILYENFKRTSSAIEVATKSIGFSSKSSSGMQVMASLSYYGLINIEGTGADRRVSVSDLAFKIIFDKRPESTEREAAIKEAALNPALFKKIKEFYGNQIPNDSSLEYDLPFKFKFNPGTVREFIRVFKDTMDFAKVYESDIMAGENISEEDSGMIPQEEKMEPRGLIPPGTMRPPVRTVAGDEREKALYSLGGDLKVRIVFSGTSTISDKAIEKLMKLLAINKEDFIEEKVDDKEPK
jgi:hypothetical protein